MAVSIPSPLVTGYVLAGGASSRMGRDKAFLSLENRTLVQIALAKLSELCSEVAILCGPATEAGRVLALQCFARTVADADHLRQGPAAGIAAALADADTPWVLVLAVDQPFLPVMLLGSWLATTIDSGVLASCMTLGGHFQPVPVLLRTRIRAEIEKSLRNGERKVRAVLETALSEANLPGIQSFTVQETAQSLAWFRNLNYPADLPGEIEGSLSANKMPVGASET